MCEWAKISLLHLGTLRIEKRLKLAYNIDKIKGGEPQEESEMKKYNKHEIMVNAWNIRHTNNVSMSTALRAAWALAKAVNTAEAVASEIEWNTKVRVNDWVKYGKSRTYVEVAVYTNAWNRKRTEKIGYVDNMTGEFVAA